MLYTLNTTKITLVFNNFTYNMTCSDISWNYTALFNIPSSVVNFTETLTGGQFDIWSNDLTLNSTSYNITYIGTVGGGGFMYSLNQTF